MSPWKSPQDCGMQRWGALPVILSVTRCPRVLSALSVPGARSLHSLGDPGFSVFWPLSASTDFGKLSLDPDAHTESSPSEGHLPSGQGHLPLQDLPSQSASKLQSLASCGPGGWGWEGPLVCLVEYTKYEGLMTLSWGASETSSPVQLHSWQTAGAVAPSDALAAFRQGMALGKQSARGMLIQQNMLVRWPAGSVLPAPS